MYSHVRHLLAKSETTVVGRQKYSANAHASRILSIQYLYFITWLHNTGLHTIAAVELHACLNCLYYRKNIILF